MSRWVERFFPETPRRLPWGRWARIFLRTGHLIGFSFLVGGHAFEASPQALSPYLWLTVLTGIALIVLELYESCFWLVQVMGLLVMGKVLLVALVPWCWSYRLWLLLAVTVIGSVGSHMSGKYRHYSLWHRRVL